MSKYRYPEFSLRQKLSHPCVEIIAPCYEPNKKVQQNLSPFNCESAMPAMEYAKRPVDPQLKKIQIRQFVVNFQYCVFSQSIHAHTIYEKFGE